LHVFTYSERPNTPANEMENAVPMHKRRERNEMLRILSEKKRRAFYQQFLGQTREVLFEKHKNSAFLTGFTDNYIKIELPKNEENELLTNFILPVDLKNFNDEGDVKAQLATAVLV
jgi:threonylcarbamoyladenosine tRNA methylthiotransferase MtaB